jgi:hypothetical protein
VGWSTRKKLLLQLVLIPVLLLGVEGIFRVWLRVTAEPYDAQLTAKRIQALADRIDRPLVAWNTGAARRADAVGPPPERVPSPTHGWDYDNVPARIRSLQRYFRTEKGKETYDVMIIGGSVAAGFHRDGSERLIELLSADPRLAGRPVSTFGMARGGFKQPQQLNQVSYALAMGITPDAVLNLDGFNEVALGNQNTGYYAHPLHPSIPHWGHLVIFGRADKFMLDGMVALRGAQLRARSLANSSLGWEQSAVLGRLFERAMFGVRGDHVKATMQYGNAIALRGRHLRLFGPDFDRDFEAVMEQVVSGWAEASRSLHAICEAHSVHYVHALQPTLHDHGSKPLTPDEVRTGAAHPTWEQSVPRAYPLLREAGASLREDGVAFVDGSMVLRDSEETLYFDACHFHPPGQVLLAEEIAAGFLNGLGEE